VDREEIYSAVFGCGDRKVGMAEGDMERVTNIG
jgi:hypothetical protein